MSQTIHPFNSIKKLDFLEGLRGLASLYVVIHHARWFLWAGYSNGYLKHHEEFNLMNKFLVYFFSLFIYGHETVIFFFILSGFVIHLRYSRNLIQGKTEFNFKQYFLRRFKRIYPPLVFAIIFTFIIDSVGKYYSFPIYEDGTPFGIVKDNFTIHTLTGNLVFLMETYVETWGSDFALWSLKFEWWFYMFYPIFFYILRKTTLAPFAVIVLLYLFSFYPEFWPSRLLCDIFTAMLIWWLGVLLADIYTGRLIINMKYLIPLTLTIPTQIIFHFNFSRQVQDLLWGIGFTGILSLFLYLAKREKSLKFLEKMSSIGSYSYSLYITHMPILVLISGYLLKRNAVLPLSFEYVIGGSIACIVFAWIVHFLIEKPFLSHKTNK